MVASPRCDCRKGNTQMTLSRRELLAAAALLPATRALAFIPERPSPKAIADAALLAARRGGATYAARAAKGAVPQVKAVRGFCRSVAEEKAFFSSDGSAIEQMLFRVHGGYTITVVDGGEFEDRSHPAPPMGAGFEHLERQGLVEEAPGLAREALEKLRADRPTAGPRDLVLHPTHLWLTIH